MNENASGAALPKRTSRHAAEREPAARAPYEPPRVERISLDCEISSYAPDEGDTPLF